MAATPNQPVSVENLAAAIAGAVPDVISTDKATQQGQYEVFCPEPLSAYESITLYGCDLNQSERLVTLDVPAIAQHTVLNMSNGGTATCWLDQLTGQFKIHIFNATAVIFYKAVGNRSGGGV